MISGLPFLTTGTPKPRAGSFPPKGEPLSLSPWGSKKAEPCLLASAKFRNRQHLRLRLLWAIRMGRFLVFGIAQVIVAEGSWPLLGFHQKEKPKTNPAAPESLVTLFQIDRPSSRLSGTGRFRGNRAKPGTAGPLLDGAAEAANLRLPTWCQTGISGYARLQSLVFPPPPTWRNGYSVVPFETDQKGYPQKE